MPSRYTAVALSFLSLLLGLDIASAQESEGTPEQRAACAPDAFRLCSSYIPNPGEVASCLRQKRAELSDPCRSVFDRAAGATADRAKLRRLRSEY